MRKISQAKRFVEQIGFGVKKIVYELIEEQRTKSVVVMATNEAEDQRCASQFCRLD